MDKILGKNVLILFVAFLFGISILGFCPNTQIFAVGEVVTISYDTNGGEVLENSQVTQGSAYSLSVPTRLGYDFAGWTYENTSVDTTGESWEIVPEGYAMTLVASWNIKTYDIVYTNIDDIVGVNSNPTTYKVTDTVILESVEKTGYDFAGWYCGLYGLITQINPGDRVGDLTLEASWTPTNYTITYNNTFDSNNNNVVSYTIESNDITFSSLIRIGYQFDGWFGNEDFSGEAVTGIITGSQTGNITLYAKWSIKQCTVTFNEGGFDNITQNFETTLTELPTPTKEGYTFLGWYSNSGLTVQFSTNTALTGDVTLYAKWSQDINTIWYYLSGGLMLVTLILGIWYIVFSRKREQQNCEF